MFAPAGVQMYPGHPVEVAQPHTNGRGSVVIGRPDPEGRPYLPTLWEAGMFRGWEKLLFP